jgi:hypothetical protein
MCSIHISLNSRPILAKYAEHSMMQSSVQPITQSFKQINRLTNNQASSQYQSYLELAFFLHTTRYYFTSTLPVTIMRYQFQITKTRPIMVATSTGIHPS